jgi:hypothetical protein
MKVDLRILDQNQGRTHILNLALIPIVDDKSSPIDITVIIASKNIIDLITIEALRSVALMKNNEIQSKEQYENIAQSTSSFTTKINLKFNSEIGETFNDVITSNFDDANIF